MIRTYLFPSAACQCGNDYFFSVFCIMCELLILIGRYLGMPARDWLMRIHYERWREGGTNRLNES